MQKDDSIYVGHMLDTARKVLARVRGKGRSDFDASEDLRVTVAHFIQVIGEAASRVSLPTRERHPEIPWNAVIGMRHRIVHDYMSVDEDVVWEVATRDLEPLAEALSRLLPPETS
jgi:uncharacterized protein with HEPN domain